MNSRKNLGLFIAPLVFALLAPGLAGCGSQEQGPQKTLPGDYSGPPGGGAAAGGGAPAQGAGGAEGSPVPSQRPPQ
jgi:hypothetical protein